MGGRAPGRVRAVGLCCVALVLVAGAPRLSYAVGEYVLDVTGTLEITGETDRPDPGGERVVQYWVTFKYREAGVEGASFQDHNTQVTDGTFEVEGLLLNKVYRVIVQRVIIDPGLPGGGARENIPLYIPIDFWKTAMVAPGAPAPAPVEIELAIAAPAATDEPARALSFQYNGKEVRLAAYTADEGVI